MIKEGKGRMAEQTEEMHTYHGNCHCGAFGFVAKLPELRDVHACNCSICVRVSRLSLEVCSMEILLGERDAQGKRSIDFVVDSRHA